ncbi:hypothetical protein [Polaromonas sp. YR568]|uniref:hypothetical protein n=1 Tax=Polaromonas sp. YR568 TaxID=1855301 RepID=UPI003138254F
MASSKALVLAAFGARGTGKTAWVKQQIAAIKPPRLMVWDFKHDPALASVGKPFTDLAAFIRALEKPTFQARYLVDHRVDFHAQFELFCLAAWEAGRVLMFVDELPEVTKANKAPPAWRRCVNIGRDYRLAGSKDPQWLSIIGAGQRTKECDKSFIGNADVLHTGRLSNVPDAKELAQSLGCDYRDLLTLPDLHWIERRAGQIEPTRGKLTFSAKKTTPAAAGKPRLRDDS